MKRILLILISIPLILVVTLVVILALLDPDAYRDDIEGLAKQHAGINLRIEGPLAWSYWPLGLELNALQVNDQSDAPFALLNHALLKVDTLSLLKMSPQVAALRLQGLDLNLHRDSDGKSNWENLLPSQAAGPAEHPASSHPSADTTVPAGSDIAETKSKPLNFRIEDVQFVDLNMQYQDALSKQSLVLSGLELLASGIAPDSLFPLSIKGSIRNEQPVMSGQLDLNTHLRFSNDYKRFSVQELLSQITLNLPDITPATVVASVGLDTDINLEAGTVNLPRLRMAVAEFVLETQARITKLNDQPEISAELSIPAFNLKQWLTKLKFPLPPMQNPEALSSVSLNTDVHFGNQALAINELKLGLDSSQFTGDSHLQTETGALRLSLHGDQITIDDYLPPASGDSQGTSSTPDSKSEAPSDPELLPLETLRNQDLEIALKQDVLRVKDHELRDSSVEIRAKQGVISIPVSTKVMDGGINALATVDVSSSTPAWKWTLAADSVTLPDTFVAEVMDIPIGVTGQINLDSKGSTAGNRVSTIRQQIVADLNLDVQQGAITGINLNHLACKGFALVNSDSISKQDWPEQTTFRTLAAKVDMKGHRVNLQSLTVENLGLQASGQGHIELEQQTLDTRLALRAIGELGDTACRVHDKVQNLSIPVRCKGAFTDAPASLCQLDSKALTREAGKLAKQEAVRKAEKEIDRAIDKKVNKKLEKYLGEDSGVGDALKKGLKNLF